MLWCVVLCVNMMCGVVMCGVVLCCGAVVMLCDDDVNCNVIMFCGFPQSL